MKKKIQNVEIEVIVLEANDILTTSGEIDGYSTQALVGGRYSFDSDNYDEEDY